jgi:ankyrin repeat protein
VSSHDLLLAGTECGPDIRATGFSLSHAVQRNDHPQSSIFGVVLLLSRIIYSRRGGVMNRNLTLLGLLVCFLIPSSGLAQPAQKDPIPERALVNAVEKSDRAKVLDLLNQGAPIDKVWINDTPLETAIFQQDIPMVTLLLDKGAKINPEDLADAAHGAQGDRDRALSIVKLLIAKGADVRSNGADALSAAAVAGNLAVLRLLLAKGANPNGLDHNGEGVLMGVVGRDSLDTVKALIEAGADVKAVNKNQETVLMHAARTDYRSETIARVTLLKLLIDHGSEVSARDKEGRTALHYASIQVMSEGGGFTSRPEVVRLLLDNGAPVNAPDNRGQTALMETVQEWHSPIEISQLLIERGADVNLADNQGITALMYAAEKGRSDLAQLFLDKGTSLNAKDKLGSTALVHAVTAGQSEMVTLLKSRGADLSLTPYKTDDELKRELQNSSLIRAITYRKRDEVKKLLADGADPNSRIGPLRVPALVVASGYNFDAEIVNLLLAGGANVDGADDEGNTPLMEAAHGNIGEVITILLEHKAAVNLQNKKQQSALLLAAEEGGHAQIAELLLAKGADLRARDTEGRTALLLGSSDHFAQDELLKLLLAKGADVNEIDNHGNTALMLAASADAFQVIETLLAAGANVNARNKDGWTALRFTRESKEANEESGKMVVKLLQKAGAKD